MEHLVFNSNHWSYFKFILRQLVRLARVQSNYRRLCANEPTCEGRAKEERVKSASVLRCHRRQRGPTTNRAPLTEVGSSIET